MRTRFLIPLLMTFLACTGPNGADNGRTTPEQAGFSSERLERLDGKIQEYINDNYIPGSVVMLARNGKVFYEKSFGYRDVTAKDPMEIDDIFRIASMSKPIIATAVMTLFEEGAFLLTDPVSRYIPEFKNPMVIVLKNNPAPGEKPYDLVPADREITIYHLLTHTSGISYGGGLQSDIYTEAGIQTGIYPATGTIGENMRKLAALPLLHHPGERFTYGLNNDVLGYLIEVLSGMPLDEFCRTRIFEPLGMTDTCFFVPEGKLDRLAALYELNNDGTIKPDSPQPPEEPRTLFSGGAGIRSTAADYMRFARMILNGGELDGVRILGPKTVAIMTTNQIDDRYSAFRENSGDRYGLGFGIRSERDGLSGNESLGILGWDGAHLTRFWIDPQEELICVFMSQIRPRDWRIKNTLRVLVYQALMEPKGD